MKHLLWLSISGVITLSILATDLPPDLTITLGEKNAGTGLTVPSDGDGINQPVTIQGIAARRIQHKPGSYLYVVIQHPDYNHGPRDLYVVAEVFDDCLTRLGIQYDQADETPNTATKYSAANGTAMMTQTGKWRKCYFHLPDCRLGHGQNFGADFRFSGSGIALRSITVTPRKPDGFDPDKPIDDETLRNLQVQRPGTMELTFGNDATPADAAVFKALSVTSVESYVDWAGVEPTENHWDWSKWDKQVATLKQAKLKWVPFLIAGPAYATPLWFQNGPHSHYYRCLEHDQECKVQSIFNPDWPAYVERFLKAFADRYRDSGVIQSLLLGVTGIYGESIYPAGPEGGWTARLTGSYHNHHGWWANDPYAAAAFRTAMQKKYADIASLNQAWTTSHKSFDDVVPFLPEKAPGDRARADFVEWYQQSMTDWAAFWVRATRAAFPNTEIYLCTGGDGTPRLGADFTAQAAAILPHRAGIRITNEGSDYAHNFSLTREVATATRFYQSFCGFEPAAGVSSTGVVARIYNATASGARELHYYTDNVLGLGESLQNFRANAASLIPRQPRVTVALYLSRESWALDPTSINRLHRFSQTLRDLVDHDYITRRTVADGILKNYGTLVLAESPALEPAAAKAIEEWVNAGGVLITIPPAKETTGSRLYDNAAWRERLFATTAAADGFRVRRVGKGQTVLLPESSASTGQQLASLLHDTPSHLKGVAVIADIDGQLDGRFATQTDSGILWYIPKESKILSGNPAH